MLALFANLQLHICEQILFKVGLHKLINIVNIFECDSVCLKETAQDFCVYAQCEHPNFELAIVVWAEKLCDLCRKAD